MKAAFLYGLRDIRVEEVIEPGPEDGEVLIEPRVVGICGSDMNMYRRGPMTSQSLVIGHECCGHIVKLDIGSPAYRTPAVKFAIQEIGKKLLDS